MSVRRMSLCSLRSSTNARGLKLGISPAVCVGQFVVSQSVIGPIAVVPDSTLSRISSGCMPAAQTAPLPVMTMRFAMSASLPARPSTSSGWRITMQLFDPPKPKELESVIRTRPRCGVPVTKLRSQSGSRSTRLALIGISPRAIASAHTTPSTAPAAAIRWPIVLLVELTRTRIASSPNTARMAAVSLRSFMRRGGAVRVDVVDVGRRGARIGQRLAHRLDRDRRRPAASR